MQYREDIIAISAGGMHTVGIRSDGTVIAVGVLKKDGTVVGAGEISF